MEVQGRILRVLPVRSGVSQRGEWKVLPFVFEFFEKDDQRWSDKVLLETMDNNIMAQIGAYLKKGQDGKAVVENGECVLLAEFKCKIGFSHSVRTFDRQDGTKVTINDLRIYKFEPINAQQHAQQPQGQQSAQQQYNPVFGQQGAAPFPPQVDANGNPTYDDLPF